MFTFLEVEGFTAFVKERFEWSPGVNVLVGENGTGKTHLLKLLYCLQKSGVTEGKDADVSMDTKIANVFCPKDGDLSRLVRRKQGTSTAEIKAQWGDTNLRMSFSNARNWRKDITLPRKWTCSTRPLYIPAKEVFFLSWDGAFLSLYDRYNLKVDEVHCDLLKLLSLPPIKDIASTGRQEAYKETDKALGGSVQTDSKGNFYLKRGRAQLEMALVEEGGRKLSLLWRLMHNGVLLDHKTLYWDEPEANLNPSMMRHVANILLLLARSGTQIFVATHSFEFLQELEILKKKKETKAEVMFFALALGQNREVTAKPCDSYEELEPNKISDEHQRLFDEEVEGFLEK